MKHRPQQFSNGQLLFKELFVGTLLYVLVLGFFDDYTAIVTVSSFSVLFLASIVLETLTFGAFQLKGSIVGTLRPKNTPFLMAFLIWLVMFSSKFVFVWVIDLLFGDLMNINGFFGIFAIVLSVTVIHRLADALFIKLGSPITETT